jgi:hypothetical protein
VVSHHSSPFDEYGAVWSRHNCIAVAADTLSTTAPQRQAMLVLPSAVLIAVT